MRFTKSTLLAAATLGFVAGTASADLYVYEPFDYTATDGVAAFLGDGDQSGAFGTTGTWRQTTTVTVDAQKGDVFGPGLTFTDGGGNDLATAGNYFTRGRVRVITHRLTTSDEVTSKR